MEKEKKLIKRIGLWQKLFGYSLMALPLVMVALLILMVVRYFPEKRLDNVVSYILAYAGLIFSVIFVFVFKTKLESEWENYVGNMINDSINKNLRVFNLLQEIHENNMNLLAERENDQETVNVLVNLIQNHNDLSIIYGEKIKILEKVISIWYFMAKNKAEVHVPNLNDWEKVGDIIDDRTRIFNAIDRSEAQINKANVMMAKLK